MRFKQKQPVVQTAINNALSGGGGGGTGGTTDYTELENKPQINSVTLSGNKTTSDLGIDEVPEVTSEDNGKVLTATYSGAMASGYYQWGNPLNGATIGTNYIEFGNGLRLYVSSTEPTGTIPEGSIGVGF